MAKNIHPNLSSINVKCSSCGNAFVVHTTIEGDALDIENCHHCSPIYTGKRNVNMTGHDTAFKDKYAGFSKFTDLSSNK